MSRRGHSGGDLGWTTQLTPPAVEPIALDLAKTHLRVEHVLDDDYISSLIRSARTWVEEYTRRALIRQKWRLTLTRFPVVIDLARPPVISIEDIAYADFEGVLQSIPTNTYQVDYIRPFARIWALDAWPTLYPPVTTVTVDYWAGYTDGRPAEGQPPEDGDPLGLVPAPIKHAILLLVGSFYEHREDFVVGNITQPIPFGVEDLLSPYRALRYS